MKLKKLLAAAASAALAMSTMAVTPIIADAANAYSTYTLYEFHEATEEAFADEGIPDNFYVKNLYGAVDSIAVTIDGEGPGIAHFYVVWKNSYTDWSSSPITVNKGEYGWDCLSSDKDGHIFKMQNFTKINNIYVTIDGGEPQLVWSLDDKISEWYHKGNYSYDVNADKLKDIGVTAANLKNCIIRVSYGDTAHFPSNPDELVIKVVNGSTVYSKNLDAADVTDAQKTAGYIDYLLTDITDADAKKVINGGMAVDPNNGHIMKVQLLVPAGTPHVHTPNSVWDSTERIHWQTCIDGDEEIMNLDYHHFNDVKTLTMPSCSAEGSKIVRCNDCGYEMTVMIPKTKHTFEEKYTCDNDKHWQECSVCRSTDEHAKRNYEEHNYKTLTVLAAGQTTKGIVKKTCRVCDYVTYEEVDAISGSGTHAHFAEKWKGDKTNHWRVCVIDGKTFEKSEHNFDNGTVIDGVTVYTCQTCQYRLCGDLDQNGTIDHKDMVILQKALSGETAASKVFDLNGDESIDNWDLSELRKMME